MKFNSFIFGVLATISMSRAGNIISVQGQADGTLAIFNTAPVQIGYAAWSQSGSFTDVTISATLAAGSGGDVGSAYLSTTVGAGAVAFETASFNFPAGAGASVTLFSGLSLGPGSYFLVIAPNDGQIFSDALWLTASNPQISSDFGAASSGFAFANFISLENPPAVDWTSAPDLNLMFSVTGTLAPEPGSLLLVCSGLIAAIKFRQSSRL